MKGIVPRNRLTSPSSAISPAEGADAAERAIRLDPNAPAQTLRFQSGGLYASGRYKEAIRIRQRVSKAKFIDADYVELAIFFAADGRIDEAKALAAEAHVAHPSISIEGWTGDAGWTDTDRQQTILLMRKAGFRACASENEVKVGGNKFRCRNAYPRRPATEIYDLRYVSKATLSVEIRLTAPERSCCGHNLLEALANCGLAATGPPMDKVPVAAHPYLGKTLPRPSLELGEAIRRRTTIHHSNPLVRLGMPKANHYPLGSVTAN